ncbi:MAG: DUF349 domain-containing protein [Lentisphaerae bacterium]|nr:DUF349 domain-containing protein [Lentisphaerota bacterium]
MHDGNIPVGCFTDNSIKYSAFHKKIKFTAVSEFEFSTLSGYSKTMFEIFTEKSFLEKDETMSDVCEALRANLHAREKLCEDLAALPERAGVEDYAGAIAAICAEYAASPVIPPEYTEVLDKKFSEALEIAKKGAERFESRRNELNELASAVDALFAAGDLVTLKEVCELEKKIIDLQGDAALIAAIAPLKERLQSEADAEKAAGDAVLKLAGELASLTALEEVAPLHDRKPEIEKEFAAIVKPPRSAVARYQEALRKAAVRLAQHYETLDLARWESYTLKLDICQELEKLMEVPANELGNASKKLNELREKWKNLGSVPKEKNEEINPRYLDLTRKLQHRIDEHFAHKRQLQKIAVTEKQKICEECEAMADSTDWNSVAARFRALQEQWKTLERAGAQESALFARFRASADKFFGARKAAFDERDRITKAAVARKKELIAEAQTLTDVRRAKQLREEYRNSGSAGRKESELYKEFNAAMDKFFSGRREEISAKENRARELIAEVEKLCANPQDALVRSREIKEELRSISCRETRFDEQKAWQKFEAALAKVREEERRRRIAASGDAAVELASLYSKFLAGEAVVMPEENSYAGFAKLQNFASLLANAVSGDAKAAEKLAKQSAAALSERESICAKLEKLAGNNPDKAEDEAISLAMELQNAMMGNFGKSAPASAPVEDPGTLLADFAGCGIVPIEKLTALQARVDAAAKVIFPEK